MAGTILAQMASFAIMIAIGALAGKTGIIRRETLSDIIALATNVLLPIMLFSFIYSNATREVLMAHAPMAALTAVFYLVITAVLFPTARLLGLDAERSKTFRLIFTFGNTGFIGLPLLSTIYPETGAVDLALFMLVDQAVFWTYGLRLATARTRQTPFNARNFLNPNIVVIFATFAIALSGARLPAFLASTLSTIGAAASPLCMICLGAMCYFSSVRSALLSRDLYVGIAVKMVVMPIIAGKAILACGLPIDHCLAVSFIVMMAMPATTLVPLCVERHGAQGESEYATVLSVATIIASVATVPFVATVLAL